MWWKPYAGKSLSGCVCACVCLYVDEKQPSKGDGEIQQYGAKKEKEIEWGEHVGTLNENEKYKKIMRKSSS